MKISPLTFYKHSIQLQNLQKVSSTVCNNERKVNCLLYNPKSYISFGQPYNDNIQPYNQFYGVGAIDYENMPVAEIRRLEQQRKEMQDKNDYLWALSWDKEKAKKEYAQKAENFIKTRTAGFWSHMSNSNKEYWRKYYRQEYLRDLSFYNRIMKNEDYYKSLLEKDIHTRLRSAAEIMQNTKNKLDKDIAGYEDFKTNIYGSFISPVTKELLEGGEQKVYNGILICGPTGCGKTLAAETLANETYCTVDRIGTDIDPSDFDKKIDYKIKESKTRYYEKQKQLDELKNSQEYQAMTQEQKDEALRKIGSPRTVIVIDEFDRYFNPLTCEPNIIEKNTDAIKSMFDGCSKLPQVDDPAAAAVTFVCTTNYPERIPLGEININKLKPIALFPPQGKDFEDVVRHYLKYANELIKENQKTTPGLQLIDVDNIKLEKFAEKFAPNLEDGAISNDAIRFNVINAAKDYIDDPRFDFNIYLLRTFKYSVRDIRPQKLQKYTEQLSNIGFEVKADENYSTLEKVQARIDELEAMDQDELFEEEIEELQNLYELREKFMKKGV